METHFFQRATTKVKSFAYSKCIHINFPRLAQEDYLNFLARLLIHIKELSRFHFNPCFILSILTYLNFSGAKQKATGVTGAAVGGNIQQQNPQQQGGQDPINALQSMARQSMSLFYLFVHCDLISS